jgi:hypothetical protein
MKSFLLIAIRVQVCYTLVFDFYTSSRLGDVVAGISDSRICRHALLAREFLCGWRSLRSRSDLQTLEREIHAKCVGCSSSFKSQLLPRSHTTLLPFATKATRASNQRTKDQRRDMVIPVGKLSALNRFSSKAGLVDAI